MKNRNTLIEAVVIAVVFFFIGAQYGAPLFSARTPGNAPLQAPGVPIPPSPDGLLHVVYGTIIATGKDSITVQRTLVGASQSASVTVGIGSSTIITEQVLKDPQSFQKEMQAFEALMSNDAGRAGSSSATSMVPPMPFTSKPATIVDLTAGMFVTVTPVAYTKENATSFQAVTILAHAGSIMPPPSAPSSGAPYVPSTQSVHAQ